MNQESTPLPTAQEVLVSRRTLTIFCESLEDEAYAMTQPDRAAKLDDHARGFYRGQRDAAKRIRRVMFDGEVATTESASALVDRLIDSVAEDAFGGREDQSPETKAARATLIALVASQGAGGGDADKYPKPGSFVWQLSSRIGDLTAENTRLYARIAELEADLAERIRRSMLRAFDEAATPSEEPAQGEDTARLDWLLLRGNLSRLHKGPLGWYVLDQYPYHDERGFPLVEVPYFANAREAIDASRTAAAASKEGGNGRV